MKNSKMGNKKFPLNGDVRLYPTQEVERTLEKTWFVKWRINGRPKKLNVPNRKDLASRYKAADELIQRIKDNPANPVIKKEVVSATAQTEKIYKSIAERGKLKGLEKKTIQSYQGHVRNLDKFCKENGFRTVSEVAAKSFILDMIDEEYHPITINNHRRTFNTLFNALKKSKEVRQNPFESIEKLIGESDTRSHFTDSQLKLVKKTLNNKGLAKIEMACQYFYYLLCRPKELRLITLNDVNFEEWTMRITWRVGKTNKKRFVIIPDGLKEWMIDNKIEDYPSSFYLCGHSGFPSEKPVGVNYWSSNLTPVLREMGFDESYVLYSFKNTGAIKWYKATKDLVVVQRQIGHQDPKTTTIYFRSLGVMDFDHVRSMIPTF